MDEEQFWGTVFPLILSLRLINTGQIPKHHASVRRGGGKHVPVDRAESYLIYFIFVVTKREKLRLHVTGVPNCD